MVDNAKLKEVFSDKAYVESITKLSAEDAAKSLQEKGVDVTAEDLVKLHEFIVAHQEELQNGELSEDALTDVVGGMSAGKIACIVTGVLAEVMGLLCLCGW